MISNEMYRKTGLAFEASDREAGSEEAERDACGCDSGDAWSEFKVPQGGFDAGAWPPLYGGDATTADATGDSELT